MLERLTIPFSRPTTSNTSCATSSIRLAAAFRAMLADCTTLRPLLGGCGAELTAALACETAWGVIAGAGPLTTCPPAALDVAEDGAAERVGAAAAAERVGAAVVAGRSTSGPDPRCPDSTTTATTAAHSAVAAAPRAVK